MTSKYGCPRPSGTWASFKCKSAGSMHEWIEWTGDAASHQHWGRVINLPDGGNVLAQHCLKAGCGVRDGFTEPFNRFAWRPDWGLNLVTEGAFRYSVIDEKHPLISAERRFFDIENEDFDVLWPDVKPYHWIKLAVINCTVLRPRMRWHPSRSASQN